MFITDKRGDFVEAISFIVVSKRLILLLTKSFLMLKYALSGSQIVKEQKTLQSLALKLFNCALKSHLEL